MNKSLMKRLLLRRFSFLSLVSATLLFACHSPLLPDEEDDPWNPGTGGEEERTDTVSVDTVPIVHTGSDGDPYTVAEAQTIGKAESVWVEGYVVGAVRGSMNTGCVFEPPFEVGSNILLADTFPADVAHCLPVELKDGSLYQYALNLVDNPDVLHARRRIKGDLATYFHVVGLRNVTIVSEPHPEGDEGEGQGGDEGQPGDSITCPLSIEAAIDGQGDDSYSEQKWVRGFIVGYSSGKGKVVFADTLAVGEATETNVVLADSVGETDKEKIIVVKLTKGFIRDDVNLSDHPENLGHRLTVNGNLKPYNSLPGIVDVMGGGRREDLLGVPFYVLE